VSVPKRFGVIRFFGSLLKVLAWIVLVLSIISAVGFGIAGSALGNFIPGGASDLVTAGGGIAAGIGILIVGLMYFLILYVTGEVLHLQLAVEENTRLTAALLLRMHQDSQIDSSATYSGGFASEPFDG
jgi:hypothetical protein